MALLEGGFLLSRAAALPAHTHTHAHMLVCALLRRQLVALHAPRAQLPNHCVRPDVHLHMCATTLGCAFACSSHCGACPFKPLHAMPLLFPAIASARTKLTASRHAGATPAAAPALRRLSAGRQDVQDLAPARMSTPTPTPGQQKHASAGTSLKKHLGNRALQPQKFATASHRVRQRHKLAQRCSTGIVLERLLQLASPCV